MTWNSSKYDWPRTTPGIAGAEIRAINAFTVRYALIEAVGDRELIMTQDSWQNQVIGHDTIPQSNADFGGWVQNTFSLLQEGGQFYLDSKGGLVCYMPLAGEDKSNAQTYLGTLEALYSEISHNDISIVPYSRRCYGYGWGSNDARGSQTYTNRGLYDYQPLCETPTTCNLIQANLIHSYGLSHTNLGATYTLSKSPSALFTENYAFNSSWFGFYTDEGSNSYITTKNNYLSNGADEVNFPNGSGIFNNTFIRNYAVTGLAETDEEGHRVAYRAGSFQDNADPEAVSNPSTADTNISLNFPATLKGSHVTANVSNFDDSDFSGVTFSATVSGGYSVTAISVPSTVPANGIAPASWTLCGGNSCTPPTATISVTYTNSPIRTAGRDITSPFDNWAAIYKPSALSSNGSVTAQILSLDPVEPSLKAGVDLRSSLATNRTATNLAKGCVVVIATPQNELLFQWDANGDDRLDANATVAGVSIPVGVRLTMTGLSCSGYQSKNNGTSWIQIGGAVQLNMCATQLDAGVITTSHSRFNNATAVFGRLSFA